MILCITGMPGSGKSIVAEEAATLGYRVITMGDVIREEARARRMEESPKNLGALMLRLRKEEGKDVIAKRCLTKAQGSEAAVIEGVRSLDELDFFRKNAPIVLMAVHASPNTRYQRLLKRGRADDPKDPKTFQERDNRELGVGIGSVIALADKILINEGSLEDLRRASNKILRGMRIDDKGPGEGRG